MVLILRGVPDLLKKLTHRNHNGKRQMKTSKALLYDPDLCCESILTLHHKAMMFRLCRPINC